MTFSIAGRCARTGMLGAIVTTSSIAVGSRCCFAAAGVGAALTQHTTDPRLGPLMLDQLRRGYTAEQAIGAAVGGTPRSDWRQLAVIDVEGRTASFSGAASSRSAPRRMDATASRSPISCAPTRCRPRWCKAFEADPAAPLALRLIAALEAGEAAGGEFKPLSSAGLVVAHREVFPYVDLRVDSDGDPIKTLRRLWQRIRAARRPVRGTRRASGLV